MSRKDRRSKGGSVERRKPYKVVSKRFLIVCGGVNTEVTYFNQFKLNGVVVKVVGKGIGPLELVEKAWGMRREKDGSEYDEVWVVFDKDEFVPEDFNKAVGMEKDRLRVAYSNQAFEYWFLLHFEDHQGGGLDRTLYNDKINGHLKKFKCSYDGAGSKKVEGKFFEVMLSKDERRGSRLVEIAAERAERIYKQKAGTPPAGQESVTTVFRLVKELLTYS